MVLGGHNRLFPKSILVCVAVFAVVYVPEARSQSVEPRPTQDKPIVELDLHQFGYEQYRNKHAVWPTFVDFSDTQVLAVVWMTPIDPSRAAKNGIATATPAHLHVLFVNAVTGQKKGLEDFSTPSHRIRFWATRDGKFLTCSGNVLRLFSSDFSIVREKADLRDYSCASPYPREVGLSPSRQTLLLSHLEAKNLANRAILLETDTLGVIDDRVDDSVISDISDHWIVGQCGEPRHICLRGLGQKWEPLNLSFVEQTSYGRSRMRFVNDEMLAVMTANRMKVVTVGAKPVFETELGKGESFGRLATSGSGQRFAVMQNRLRGLRSEPLDMYPFEANERVVVYSIPDRHGIYAVKVKGTSPWQPRQAHVNQFSLSPDGTLLAVVCDNVLSVHQLPTP